MADIVYDFGGQPYLNITNQCPCACVFCIRGEKDGVGSAENLWHRADPTWEDIHKELTECDFSQASEAVFCGYGEPFCALVNLKRSAEWLKKHYPSLKLRINTNGLGDLIHQRATAAELKGLIDTISISLNAPNAARYHELCRSAFGEAAFEAMLKFAAECSEIYPSVKFSVVDVLTEPDIAQCQALASLMGIPLRVRRKS